MPTGGPIRPRSFNAAVALAPRRPEIIWLLLRDCQLRHCAEEPAIVQRMRAADPDNGIALLPALRDSQAGPAAETTRILAEIGASKSPHPLLEQVSRDAVSMP